MQGQHRRRGIADIANIVRAFHPAQRAATPHRPVLIAAQRFAQHPGDTCFAIGACNAVKMTANAFAAKHAPQQLAGLRHIFQVQMRQIGIDIHAHADNRRSAILLRRSSIFTGMAAAARQTYEPVTGPGKTGIITDTHDADIAIGLMTGQFQHTEPVAQFPERKTVREFCGAGLLQS